MASNFIKLHDSDNNSVIVLNIDRIQLATVSNGDGKSVIYFDYTIKDSDNEYPYITVNENPEKIYQMIEDAKKK